MVLSLGARIGVYEILGSLGAGGMGEVYRARDTRLGRDVALKILSPAFAADDVQSLWDRIAASPETIPVPEWRRQILDERVKDLEANPDVGDCWDVVQERLRRTLDNKP